MDVNARIHTDYQKDTVSILINKESIPIPREKWGELLIIMGYESEYNEILKYVSNKDNLSIVGKLMPDGVFEHNIIKFLNFNLPKNRQQFKIDEVWVNEVKNMSIPNMVNKIKNLLKIK